MLLRIFLLLALSGWGGATLAEVTDVRFLTTTSTENSGLIHAIMPLFERATGIKVRTIAVGTGRALQMARRGDGDVLLVHAKEDELKFVADGYGLHRREIMYNDFILVGAPEDAARVTAAGDVLAALRSISAVGALFISRGDDSGTHKRELSLWETIGLELTDASWYRQTGQGMGRTLIIASELGAYTLVDRGTWLSHRGPLQLVTLFENDKRLLNVYGVMAVNPAKNPRVRYEEARRLVEWLAMPRAQQAIREFRVDGKPLFHPLVHP